MVREYMDLRGRKWQEDGEDCIVRNFVTCTLQSNIIRVIKSRRMRWAEYVAGTGGMRNAYNILVGKAEGKRPTGRHRNRRRNYIRMDRAEIGWEGMDWMHLAQDRDQWWILVNTVMSLRVP
jgi:hypothetical protein